MKNELLVKAAKELDTLLFEDPQIDFKQEPKGLTAAVMEASKELEADDKLSEETIDILAQIWEGKDGKLTVEVCEIFRELGILPPVDEKEEQTEDAEVVPETDDLVNEIEDAERIKDLKDIAKSNDEFKAIRGKLNGYKEMDKLRGDMLEILDGPPVETEPEETPKAEKKVEPKAKMEIVPKDEPKEKLKVEKKSTPKSDKKTELGHKIGSQSGAIDMIFLNYVDKNIALATIAKQTDLSESRIKSHIHYLINKKKLSIKVSSSDSKGIIYKFTR